MGQDYTKHNLLFISKYPEIIHEFTDAMKDRDIEIETAINGIEAAAKIKKKNYDIVITGLSLEGYNGEQIITYLNKTAPSTVCIIYTTTISSAQLHFFINERNVFRVFLRPVDFRGVFWEALEEAYEYHAVQVKNEEDTGARRQEQEKQEREIEIMDQRMRSQRQARETTNRYGEAAGRTYDQKNTRRRHSARRPEGIWSVLRREPSIFAVSRENMQQRNRWTRRRRYCRR